MTDRRIETCVRVGDVWKHSGRLYRIEAIEGARGKVADVATGAKGGVYVDLICPENGWALVNRWLDTPTPPLEEQIRMTRKP